MITTLTIVDGINAARQNIWLTLVLICSITALVYVSQLSVDANVVAITLAIELGAVLSDRAQRVIRSFPLQQQEG